MLLHFFIFPSSSLFKKRIMRPCPNLRLSTLTATKHKTLQKVQITSPNV